jgi:hypothetical protein
VRDALDRAITDINAGLPASARIGQRVLTDTQFSHENGLMTRSLKVNRRGVYARFVGELAACGQERAP